MAYLRRRFQNGSREFHIVKDIVPNTHVYNYLVWADLSINVMDKSAHKFMVNHETVCNYSAVIVDNTHSVGVYFTVSLK